LPASLKLRQGGPRSFSDDVRIPGSTLEDLERLAILATYESTGGDTKETSRILDISQRKIQYKLRDYRDSGHLH